MTEGKGVVSGTYLSHPQTELSRTEAEQRTVALGSAMCQAATGQMDDQRNTPATLRRCDYFSAPLLCTSVGSPIRNS